MLEIFISHYFQTSTLIFHCLAILRQELVEDEQTSPLSGVTPWSLMKRHTASKDSSFYSIYLHIGLRFYI